MTPIKTNLNGNIIYILSLKTFLYRYYRKHDIMPSNYLYKQFFKYNLKKKLKIKLVLSQSYRQNGTKFPQTQASYNTCRELGRQWDSFLFMHFYTCLIAAAAGSHNRYVPDCCCSRKS